MNKVVLLGRLVRDPILKQTNSGIDVCNFTLAVNRKFRNSDGERVADFFPLVAWRHTAVFIAKHMQKGMRIVVLGYLQTSKWSDDNGIERQQIEVVVDEVDFADSKRKSGSDDVNSFNEEDDDDDEYFEMPLSYTTFDV